MSPTRTTGRPADATDVEERRVVAADVLRSLLPGSGVRRAGHRFLMPLGDPGPARYRPPPRLYARLQWLGHALTALALSPGYVVTLEVPGRRTGRPRRTTLVLARHRGHGYLVSLTGESDWVRNVRAAGGRVVLRRGRHRVGVTLAEVPPAERPPVIRAYVLRAGRSADSAAVAREARGFFGVGRDLALPEIARVADRFPVFRVVNGIPIPSGTCAPCVRALRRSRRGVRPPSVGPDTDPEPRW
ncbi:nitroreductase family deazaflavin-dependent oxidoreductase [Blastococcus sp. TF02A-26]|uniref:nitroreductase family deazaflavin-dependent oxidoreductase n=1 Tax=Blastococcus sp. TF02A-26 TaxID=2250577 RepID=UPI0018F74AD4|nr:nitroreductase family deazaflavin-dependent oxidoreductase [Blastococcus sp. TF02A-26]